MYAPVICGHLSIQHHLYKSKSSHLAGSIAADDIYINRSLVNNQVQTTYTPEIRWIVTDVSTVGSSVAYVPSWQVILAINDCR